MHMHVFPASLFGVDIFGRLQRPETIHYLHLGVSSAHSGTGTTGTSYYIINLIKSVHLHPRGSRREGMGGGDTPGRKAEYKRGVPHTRESPAGPDKHPKISGLSIVSTPVQLRR